MMRSAPLAAFVTLAALALQGCGNQPAPAPVTPTSWPIVTGSGWVKYPSYTGSLQTWGSVWIGEADVGVQSIGATLEGVDTNCIGVQTGEGNVCGMHIHSGTTCSNGTGGHYFEGNSDPWVPITYTTDGNPWASIAGPVVNTKYPISELADKVVVVHDSNGTRVACAELSSVNRRPSPFKVESFVKYPGSGTNFAVAGAVDVVTSLIDQTVLLRYALTGADPACTADAEITAANGCGIHIHEGTSCASPTGGHYSGASSMHDPWQSVTYRNEVSQGITYPLWIALLNDSEIDGRVVVVHDKNGARIACGVMVPTQSLSASARVDEAQSPLVWLLSATLVIASLGGGAWYYQSQRRGYATQQDDSTEMQNAAVPHDPSVETKNTAAQHDDSTEMDNAA